MCLIIREMFHHAYGFESTTRIRQSQLSESYRGHIDSVIDWSSFRMEKNRIDAGDQSQVTNRSADFIFVVL